MKNLIIVLAAVGLVTSIALFAGPRGDATAQTAPAAETRVRAEAAEGCCGACLDAGPSAAAVEVEPVGAAAGCGMACPEALLGGGCCMDATGAKPDVPQRPAAVPAEGCCGACAHGASLPGGSR